MKMKILAFCAVFVIAFSAMHFVEPVSAASTQKGYLIDHGTKYFMDTTGCDYVGPNGVKTKLTWKTYWYSKNVRKVHETYYRNINGKWKYDYKTIVTMKKVSKTKMKLNYVYPDYQTHGNCYIKTKMNTRNFYWKSFRPKMQTYPTYLT